MSTFIGQPLLAANISKQTLDSLPHSLLLIGPKGCGKHKCATLLAEHLCLECEDITDSISLDKLSDIQTKAYPYIYIVDGSQLTIKEENAILKFLEEPLKNAYIIVMVENKDQILSTLFNRCQVWTFESYKQEDLKHFITKADVDVDLLLDISTTPGQIQDFEHLDLSKIYSFCNNIITKIGIASASNSLKLLKSITFTDEKDKYDYKVITQVLLRCIAKKLKGCFDAPKTTDWLAAYRLTSKMAFKQTNNKLGQKQLMSLYFLELREVLKNAY